MIQALQTWRGAVEVNGVMYDSILAFNQANLKLSGDVRVKLLPRREKANSERSTKPQTAVESDEVQITVKSYMTKPASPEFDFMAKWNNNVPMPMCVMVGKKLKETPGMVYMKLHGTGKPTICCRVCGKELTNPISRHYGIGPICLSKLGITLDIEDVAGIQEKLVDIEWTGWVIRSAILREEAV